MCVSSWWQGEEEGTEREKPCMSILQYNCGLCASWCCLCLCLCVSLCVCLCACVCDIEKAPLHGQSARDATPPPLLLFPPPAPLSQETWPPPRPLYSLQKLNEERVLFCQLQGWVQSSKLKGENHVGTFNNFLWILFCCFIHSSRKLSEDASQCVLREPQLREPTTLSSWMMLWIFVYRQANITYDFSVGVSCCRVVCLSKLAEMNQKVLGTAPGVSKSLGIPINL